MPVLTFFFSFLFNNKCVPKSFGATIGLSRHVGTTTLAQIQRHGAPLVRKKTEKSNLFNFSSCIPSQEDLLLSLQSPAA